MKDFQITSIDGQPVPAGFKHDVRGSGLIVPEEVARETETWTKDEAKLLRRAEKLLKSRNIEMIVLCKDERCKDDPRMTVIQNSVGQVLVECNHKTRTVRV